MNLSKMQSANRALLLFVAAGLAGIVYAISLTHGRLDLFEPEPLSSTYTSMWDHFKKGSFAVDPDSIAFEGYLAKGRITAYQGPFPALLRGIIELFFRRGGTDWARLSCLLAALTAALFLGLAVWETRRQAPASPFSRLITLALVVSYAFGSPILILTSCAYLYHEPLLWSISWYAVYLWSALRLARTKTAGSFHRYLFLMGVSVGFAFLCRAPMGAGLLITHVTFLGLWYRRRFRDRNRAAAVATPAVETSAEVIAGPWLNPPSLSFPIPKGAKSLVLANSGLLVLLALCLGINYGRWGSPLTFSSPELNLLFLKADGSDLNGRGRKLIHDGVLRSDRIRYSVPYYFLPSTWPVSIRFPFIKEIPFELNSFQQDYDYIDHFVVPFSFNSPFLFWFGLIGLAWWVLSAPWRKGDILGISLVAGASLQLLFILMLYALAFRYQSDLLPFFIVGSLFALCFLCRLESRMPALSRRVWGAFTVSLATAGLVTAIGTTLLFKYACWGVPPDVRRTVANYIKSMPASYTRLFKDLEPGRYRVALVHVGKFQYVMMGFKKQESRP